MRQKNTDVYISCSHHSCLKKLLAISLVNLLLVGVASSADPLAANNGLYPKANEWNGPYRIPNLRYPGSSDDGVQANWASDTKEVLSLQNAENYAQNLKDYLEPTLRPMLETPLDWSPTEKNGWYNMVWSGQGSPDANGNIDPTSGRDSLLGSYSGQIMPKATFQPQYQPISNVNIQNHAVVYYNHPAATRLGDIFKNIYRPNLSAIGFPEGSIIVKTEGVTLTPVEWPLLAGTAEWHVYRPTTMAQSCSMGIAPEGVDCEQHPLEPKVIPVRALQMSIAVKDKAASPQTGWVFMALTYKHDAPGETIWDRFVPLGVQWGNDPQLAGDPSGLGTGGKGELEETWNNPEAPAFTRDTLGWGDRLAGPMDVATRHNVITVSGKRYQGINHVRASSCMSCHGAAEFPFTTNLYPSPNNGFPADNKPFLLFDQGSEQWAEWFQNRPGDQSMSIGKTEGVRATDYNWMTSFALSTFNAAAGNDVFAFEHFDAH